MMYRMKQNAAGLAAICILSTMVLVTISTTVSLYMGRNDMVTSMYPEKFAAILPQRKMRRRFRMLLHKAPGRWAWKSKIPSPAAAVALM